MASRKVLLAWQVTLALGFLMATANSAHGYVGPGTGLEFVPYFLGLVAWVGAAFAAFLLWPFYALIRRMRGLKQKQSEGDTDQVAPPQTPANP
jgi:hypothetical protein